MYIGGNILAKHKKKKSGVSAIYTFALMWIIMSLILPLHEIWGLGVAAVISGLVSYLVGKSSAKRQLKAEEKKKLEELSKNSLGPELDPIVSEGNKALSEMGRLYANIKDTEVRQKINELMRITDKIVQNAIADPADIPQTKKFMNYYLPTTIKLLHSYDRMSSQGIDGENLDKSMKNINVMLDEAIDAFKKRLDSLFADQALDIETEIEVLNTMLTREGLSGSKDFHI